MKLSSSFALVALSSLITLVAYDRIALADGRSGSGSNPDLREAKQALAELDFELARSRLERARRWGRNSPEQMREILRLAGEVQAALGAEDNAEQHFFAMLTLDPSATLPSGSSPKLTDPFARARQRVADAGGLQARCELDPATPAVTVRVTSDPASLVVGARAIYRLPSAAAPADTPTDAGMQTVEARGRDTITLALPAVAGLQLYCALIDQHGNQLTHIGSPTDMQTLSPSRVGGATDIAGTGSRRTQSLFAHWATWSTLAVVSAGAGGYFAYRVDSARGDLDALNQDSPEHDFSEARAIQQRGERAALFTNISLGVAGACAAVALVQFLRRPGPSRERTSLVAPTPLPGGAGVAVITNF